MSEPAGADTPNTLDALAADAEGAPFKLEAGDKVGYLRPQTFGDLRAYSHARTYLDKVVVLVERCGDETALEILDAMTPRAAMAKYDEWEQALAALGK